MTWCNAKAHRQGSTPWRLTREVSQEQGTVEQMNHGLRSSMPKPKATKTASVQVGLGSEEQGEGNPLVSGSNPDAIQWKSISGL